jgi:hypothetical protein
MSRTQRIGCWVGWLTVFWIVVPGASADWSDQDGVALAMAGVTAGEWLDRMPATDVRLGFTAAASHVERYLGSSVRADVVRLQAAGSMWACGGAWAEARSSVHRESSVSLALQRRHPGWRAGAGANLRTLRFDRYTASRSARAQAAIAVGILEGTEVWVHAEAGPTVTVRAGVQSVWSRTLRVVVQQARTPGLEPHTCAGVLWGRALQFAAGFDVLAGAPSGGIGFDAGRWSWSYGTQAHPQLGWSHAWTLVVRR